MTAWSPTRAVVRLVLFAALLPSVWFAWHWRSMPHASEYHDDGIYYVGAKSLAETGNYTIESLPGSPPQTKYPPLWPAVLSLAWRVNPAYPDNLPIAMALCWIWLPLSLFAYARWLRVAGFSAASVLLLGAAWAFNPYVVLFSTAMLSEMMFTFLLLAALLCMEQVSWRWAAVAGIVAGLAFLTRTAGVAILPAAAIWYVRRRPARNFFWFGAGMAPFVAGWTIWSGVNRGTGQDAVSLYYTNYLGHYFANFVWAEAHIFFWKNLDGLLHSLGALVLPDVTQSVLEKVLAICLGIGGLLGVKRLWRDGARPFVVPYSVFGVSYALLLLVWHFPPTERLVLPIAPLWFAGLYTEMRALAANIRTVFRKPELSQKVAGGMIALLIAGVFVSCAVRQAGLLTAGLPAFYEDHAARLRQSAPAMEWIRENVPLSAKILSENDPLLYFRTHRQGVGLAVVLPTIDWYREDHASRTSAFPEMAYRLLAGGVNYFIVNEWDYARDMPPSEHSALMKALRQDARWDRVFASGPTAIYRRR